MYGAVDGRARAPRGHKSRESQIKTVPRIRDLHVSQVLSYLKTTDLRVGLLMNFNTSLFKEG
jgi:hypothetical protein